MKRIIIMLSMIIAFASCSNGRVSNIIAPSGEEILVSINKMEEIELNAQSAVIDEIVADVPLAKTLLNSSALITVSRSRSLTEEKVLTNEEEDKIWESLTDTDRDKIKNIAENFVEQHSKVETPTIFYAEIPDGVIETENEVIFSNDMVISKTTSEGLKYLYEIAADFYGEGNNNRGCKTWILPTWKSGKVGKTSYSIVVNYTLKSGGTALDDDAKKRMKDAMRYWEDGVDDNLEFHEDTNWTWWDSFCYTMGWYNCVKIFIDPNISADGKAIPGMLPWSSLKLKRQDVSTKTMCHELGHVLGLMHEFDRWDAADCITWKYENDRRAYAVSLFVKLFYVDVGDFDYESIMNYDDCYYKKGEEEGSLIKSNSTPTDSDFETVENIYNL